MTVGTTAVQASYAEDGATVFRPINFQFFDAAELVVKRVSAAGVETLLVRNVDYTVAGGNGATGSVTMTAPAAAGNTLLIDRFTIATSTFAADPQASLDVTALQKALDRVTMVAQELAARAVDAEGARDVIGAAIAAGTGLVKAVDDPGNLITLSIDTSAEGERIRDIIGAAARAGTGLVLNVDDPGDTITLSIDATAEAERARDTIGATLVAGSGITITPNDAADTITIAAGFVVYTNEEARDAVGAALRVSAGLTLAVNDAADTITIGLDTAAEAERARDTIGATLVAGSGIALAVNDAADTITITATGGGGGGGAAVSDGAYGGDWDGDATFAPSRNAVYDAMEGRAKLDGGNAFTGPQEIAGKLTIDQGNVVNSYALEILNIGAGESGLNFARAGGQGQISAFGSSGGGWWNTYSANRTMRWEVANGAYDAAPQAFLWVNSVGGARANTRLKQATAGDTGDFLVAENAAGAAVARIAIDGSVFVSDAAFGAGWSGDLSVPTKNAMWAEVAFLEGEIDDLRKKIPSGAATAGRTLTSADAGKRIPATGNMTIPANAVDAIPVDTVIEIYNNTAANITVGINTDTLRLAGTATTGARTVAQRGLISLRKIGATEWLAAGPGVS